MLSYTGYALTTPIFPHETNPYIPRSEKFVHYLNIIIQLLKQKPTLHYTHIPQFFLENKRSFFFTAKRGTQIFCICYRIMIGSMDFRFRFPSVYSILP